MLFSKRSPPAVHIANGATPSARRPFSAGERASPQENCPAVGSVTIPSNGSRPVLSCLISAALTTLILPCDPLQDHADDPFSFR